jgi:hypothetical protein
MAANTFEIIGLKLTANAVEFFMFDDIIELRTGKSFINVEMNGRGFNFRESDHRYTIWDRLSGKSSTHHFRSQDSSTQNFSTSAIGIVTPCAIHVVSTNKS